MFYTYTFTASSSTSGTGGTPSNYINEQGPIFISTLQCPTSDSEDAYVVCLHEVDLGLSECDRTVIGVMCEGVCICSLVLHGQSSVLDLRLGTPLITLILWYSLCLY